MSSAVGMALVCAGHAFGWAVARGGSRSITDALAAVVLERGGRIETGVRVRSLSELQQADAVMLDLAVEDGVPWTNEACRRAGTVHVAGSFEELGSAERDINRGRMPE